MPQSSTNKRFFNTYETIVQNAIDGLLRSAGVDRDGNPKLKRLDGYPHIKVVLRGDWDKSQVAIISGGGAGHEPAHAGFVGKGMLTAAVSGEIFASPSVDAVLEAICAVTGEAGCLLVVKNYTGDRLNFGLAAERAKKRGYQVEMVIVGDDIAIPGTAQPRGIAGTLFVHKYAGYLAEQGHSLAEIKARMEAFAPKIYSLGLSLSSCAHPGRPSDPRLEANEMELGLGIHGEPGRDKASMQSAKGIAALMSEQMLKSLPRDGARYGLLLNNLGTVPPMEMNILLNELASTPLMERVDYLFGPGHLMTALDMNGFSVSLVALDKESVLALLSPVSPVGWLPGVKRAPITTVDLHNPEQDPHYSPSTDPTIKARLERALATIIAAESQLNALDAKVGDGDTGSTFARGAQAITEKMQTLPLANTADLFGALGSILGKSMGGSSGILLSIFFNAASNSMHEGESLAKALQQGIAQMQFYGGARQGSRTMLDTLIPAINELADSGDLNLVAQRAEEGAAATAAITNTESGRSAYLKEGVLKGTEDPGARAAAIVVKALLEE